MSHAGSNTLAVENFPPWRHHWQHLPVPPGEHKAISCFQKAILNFLAMQRSIAAVCVFKKLELQ